MSAQQTTDGTDVERGTAQVLRAGGLREAVERARQESRPLRIKWGVDPSGAELTLGHAVVLHNLRELQDAGHTVVLVVGDFTATIGDPSGRTSGRTVMTLEQTTENARTYLEQVTKVLRTDRLEVVHNTGWLSSMQLPEVLGYAQQATVAQLLERDDFARRHREQRPIALSEFFYPLLQGIDSVVVEADVEVGGSDQLFNLMIGRELQRAAGQRPQVVVTMPLLVGLDGEHKMSKSLGNYVAITESADEVFGKLMSIADGLVAEYARMCALMDDDQVQELRDAAAGGGPSAGLAKRALARAVVAIYHGAGAAVSAESAFDSRFRDRSVPVGAPPLTLPADAVVHLPGVLAAGGLCSSRSEARRLVDAGAVRLDGQPVAAGACDHPRAELLGRVLQVGKHREARLVA